MNSDLGFSLSGMENVYEMGTKYTANFDEAIKELDAAVHKLSTYWASEETGTYQKFESLYKEKRAVLVQARDYMQRFCNKVEEQRDGFETAAADVNRAAN